MVRTCDCHGTYPNCMHKTAIVRYSEGNVYLPLIDHIAKHVHVIYIWHYCYYYYYSYYWVT